MLFKVVIGSIEHNGMKYPKDSLIELTETEGNRLKNIVSIDEETKITKKSKKGNLDDTSIL